MELVEINGFKVSPRSLLVLLSTEAKHDTWLLELFRLNLIVIGLKHCILYAAIVAFIQKAIVFFIKWCYKVGVKSIQQSYTPKEQCNNEQQAQEPSQNKFLEINTVVLPQEDMRLSSGSSCFECVILLLIDVCCIKCLQRI